MEQNKKDFQEFRAAARKSSSASDGSAASGGSGSTDDHGEVPGGMKRGRGANQAGSQSKKAKSEERDPSGLPRGDKTRVPGVGQHVHWKYGKGYSNGQKAEASKEDPRLVLKSDSTGKLAVHKPEDVYFD